MSTTARGKVSREEGLTNLIALFGSYGLSRGRKADRLTPEWMEAFVNDNWRTLQSSAHAVHDAAVEAENEARIEAKVRQKIEAEMKDKLFQRLSEV